MKIEITNIKEVNFDFDNYSKRVDRLNKKTQRKYAYLIMLKARNILREKVQKWTGRLANSIMIRNEGDDISVSPDVPYDVWIEIGGKGGFTGYHYMEEAVDEYEEKYYDEINNNLKV